MGLNLEANGEKCAARRYLVVAYTAYSRLCGQYKRVSLAAVAYDFDREKHEP